MLTAKFSYALTLLSLSLVSAFPLNSMDEIMVKARSMMENGELHPRAANFLSDFNKHGFNKRSVISTVGTMLEGLDLPSVQPFGIAGKFFSSLTFFDIYFKLT